MKLLTVIFSISIYMVSNKPANADVDYQRLASIIQSNITNLLYYINRVDDKVQLTHGHLPTDANKINFKLGQNKQILELQASIKAHRFKKQIQECVHLYDTTTVKVLNDLKNSFIGLTDAQLNVNKIGLFNKRKDLDTISKSLEGLSLAHEVKNCQDNPSNCKITIEYPKTISNIREYTVSVETVTDQIEQTVLNTAILPTVADRVNNDVYKPVKACISKLAEQ